MTIKIRVVGLMAGCFWFLWEFLKFLYFLECPSKIIGGLHMETSKKPSVSNSKIRYIVAAFTHGITWSTHFCNFWPGTPSVVGKRRPKQIRSNRSRRKGVLRCGHSLAWWFRLQCCVTDEAMNQQLLLPNQLFDLLLSSRIGGPVVWDLLWRTGSRVHGCAVRMFMKHDFVCSLFFSYFFCGFWYGLKSYSECE